MTRLPDTVSAEWQGYASSGQPLAHVDLSPDSSPGVPYAGGFVSFPPHTYTSPLARTSEAV